MEPADQARMGHTLRSLLNDLKRDAASAAGELGLPLAEVEAYLAGHRPVPPEVVAKAAAVWPVNERDFHVVHDDAPDGVAVLRSDASLASRRVFQRGGADYYEYRDTAMSRVASFRPEWIRELCTVDTDDPPDPRVQWNRGHFLHQLTYFIGPVNFYYEVDGERHVARMSTGDSMYITPFVPHTFATRVDPSGERGVILAVTCGDKLLGDAQQELAAIGAPWAASFALDGSTRERLAGQLLEYHRGNLSMGRAELAERAGLDPRQVERFEAGLAMPSADELARLARALGVSARDLLPPDRLGSKVVVQPHASAPRWAYPDTDPAYGFVGLASTALLPHAKALEVTVLRSAADRSLDLRAGLHQWCFNPSDRDVVLRHRGRQQVVEHVLGPGDSAYLKPFVEHAFRTRGAGPARLVVMRIGGKAAGDPMRELSSLGKEATARAIQETVQWFDPAGRR